MNKYLPKKIIKEHSQSFQRFWTFFSPSLIGFFFRVILYFVNILRPPFQRATWRVSVRMALKFSIYINISLLLVNKICRNQPASSNAGRNFRFSCSITTDIMTGFRVGLVSVWEGFVVPLREGLWPNQALLAQQQQREKLSVCVCTWWMEFVMWWRFVWFVLSPKILHYPTRNTRGYFWGPTKNLWDCGGDNLSFASPSR